MDQYAYDPFADADEVEGADSDSSDHVSASSSEDDELLLPSSDADESTPAPSLSATAASSSSGTSSSSASATSSSSSEFVPYFRERQVLGCDIPHKPATVAAQGGYASVDDMRFRVALRRQHELRAHDHAFVATGESPLSLGRWRYWRMKKFLDPCGIKTANLLMEVKAKATVVRKRGAGAAAGARAGAGAGAAAGAPAPPPAPPATYTCYRCIAAVINLPEVLLNTFYSHYDHNPCSFLALVGDGVADAMPGTPGRGKAFALYLKPMSELHPQSPRWLMPLLLMLGADKASTLHPLFASIQLARMIESLPDVRYGRDPPTFIAMIAMGDFPCCVGFTSLPSPARQFPSTPGRIPAWTVPLCWHCGMAPLEMYHRTLGARWRMTANDGPRRARLALVRSVVGIPTWLIFYEIVHAINVTTQALVADIGAYFNVHKSRDCPVHPITATVHSLFPSAGWDPYLTQPASRSKERKSRKPLLATDPDVTWGWLVDAKQQATWMTLLAQHPAHLPDCSDVNPSLTFPIGPLEIWSFHIVWCEAVIVGDDTAAERAACLLEDTWRCMNSVFRPVPPAQPCALPADQRPTFFNPTVAYGPASHVALCSSHLFIRAVDAANRGWRRSGLTFAKYTAGIFLEHGMKRIRSDVSDFSVAARQKRNRALEILARMTERFMLRTVLDDFDPPCAPTTVTNRAYKDVPLSNSPPRTLVPRVLLRLVHGDA